MWNLHNCLSTSNFQKAINSPLFSRSLRYALYIINTTIMGNDYSGGDFPFEFSKWNINSWLKKTLVFGLMLVWAASFYMKANRFIPVEEKMPLSQST